MKNLIFSLTLVGIFFSLSANVIAQNDTISIDGVKTVFETPKKYVFDIQEEIRKMSEGEQPALRIHIDEADRKQAQKVWRDFMGQYDSKTKKGMFSSEYRTEKAHIYSVGGVDPINVYATFNDRDKGVDAYIWFQLSDSEFLSSGKYRNAFGEAKRIVDNYGISLRQEVTKEALEKQEKILSNFESDMKSLTKEHEKLNETIEKAEKTIERARQDLEKNAKDQESTLVKLKEQQKAVEEARIKHNATLN